MDQARQQSCCLHTEIAVLPFRPCRERFHLRERGGVAVPETVLNFSAATCCKAEERTKANGSEQQ